MSIKWETLKSYIAEMGIKKNTLHEDDMDRPSTTFMFGDADHDIRCRIILEEKNDQGEYEFLHIRLFDLVPDNMLKKQIKDPMIALNVAKFMLGWNFKRKVGSWALDTENMDGDHYLAAVFPLDGDGGLSFSQFARMFGSLATNAHEAQDSLQECMTKPAEIANNGNNPAGI